MEPARLSRLKTSSLISAPELGKLPPQAPEVEQAVLGATMLSSNGIVAVADLLTPESFYVEAHVHIYRSVLDLYRAGNEPNILTVTQDLKKRGHLDAVGGAFYVTQLTNRVSSISNLQHHAMIIVQAHMLREVIKAGSESVRAAYDETADCFDVLDKYEQGLRNCQAYLTPRAIGTAADEAEDLVNGKTPKYIQFNTPGLESLMFQCGLVHTVGGRTGMGKSIFSTEESYGWTRFGRVLMFSPEMTKRQLTSRILSRESGVPYTKILQGTPTKDKPDGMSEYEQGKVANAWITVAPRMKNLLVDDTEAITPQQIRTKIDRALGDGPLVAVVVDHLHEMQSGFHKIDQDTSSRARVAYCIGQLNSIAKKTHLPFLVMAQLNRTPEGRKDHKPQISDLFWSSDIEQKSAMILLLYRAGYYQPEPPYEDDFEMILAKYRDGAVRSYFSKVIPALSYIGPGSVALPTPSVAPAHGFAEPAPSDEETPPF